MAIYKDYEKAMDDVPIGDEVEEWRGSFTKIHFVS